MLQTWRWFGPDDAISLTNVRQTGAEGVVTALHDVAPGAVWTELAIAERREMIERAGLRWAVVESLPVHGSIRLQEPGYESKVEHYIESLENLGRAGVRIICYNFMPVLDWTRTNLDWKGEDGSVALRFDATDFAVFDLWLLRRAGAEKDYSDDEKLRAERRYAELSEAERERLVHNIAVGLPGAAESGRSLEALRAELERWSSVSPEQLRSHWIEFLRAVTPTCERFGMRLCVHPDDPPRPLLGLPRIASSSADFQALFDAVPSAANALTLCLGSLGAGRHNDLERITRELAPRVYFTHLRSVHVEDDGSFVETDHLEGDANLIELIRILIHEERRRKATGDDFPVIAMRPDHGRGLEGDVYGWPGYPWIGRLKALAELRGVMRAVEQLT